MKCQVYFLLCVSRMLDLEQAHPDTLQREDRMNGLVLKTAQDVEDLSWGATFYGVGGGGTPAEGLKLLKQELSIHGSIACIDPNDLPDDAWTATVSFMGNRAPLTAEQEAQKQRLGLVTWKYENNMLEAVRLLEEVTGKKIEALMVPELGGANTPSPIATAAALGIHAVDADYSGRAVPEIAQCGACLRGYPTTPIASVDQWGNKAVVYDVVNDALGERIGKLLATAAFGNTAIALMLLPASVMKQCVVHGTISECYRLGKAVREAGESGACLMETVLSHTGGRKLFQGTLIKRDWSVQDGYMVGEHFFEGDGEFSGHTFKVWYMNENHVTWLDGIPYATSPDIIAQVETNLGKPLLNNECTEGQHFVFIGLPARSLHLDPGIFERMNARHYGFDIEYVPVADLK